MSNPLHAVRPSIIGTHYLQDGCTLGGSQASFTYHLSSFKEPRDKLSDIADTNIQVLRSSRLGKLQPAGYTSAHHLSRPYLNRLVNPPGGDVQGQVWECGLQKSAPATTFALIAMISHLNEFDSRQAAQNMAGLLIYVTMSAQLTRVMVRDGQFVRPAKYQSAIIY
jgi:hypothetical protein